MGMQGGNAGLVGAMMYEFTTFDGQARVAGLDDRGYPLRYTPGENTLLVAYNGHWLSADEFTATDGSTITTNKPMPGVGRLKAWAIGGFNVADTFGRGEADARFNRRRNRDLDPGCRTGQQFGTTLTAMSASSAVYYASDGMAFQRGGSVGMTQFQRVASLTPGGSGYRNRLTVTTANPTPGALDILRALFPIEGNEISDLKWGTAAAKPLLKRFGLKSPVAGTFPVSVVNSGGTRSYLAGSITVQPGEVNTDLMRWLVIPGPTDGAWATDNNLGFALSITLLAGSTYTGVVGWQPGVFYGLASGINGMLSAGLSFDFFDYGLYDVSDITTPTPPRFELASPAADEWACYRYYWQTDNNNGAAYSVSGNGRGFNYQSGQDTVYFGWKHPLKMRTVPNTIITYDINDAGEQVASGQSGSAEFTNWGIAIPGRAFCDIHQFTASARMI